jgi:hypothetical protein
MIYIRSKYMYFVEYVNAPSSAHNPLMFVTSSLDWRWVGVGLDVVAGPLC